MAKIKISIEVDATQESFLKMIESQKLEAGQRTRPEIEQFEHYLIAQGSAPLAEWEKILLVEFICWKVMNEKES